MARVASGTMDLGMFSLGATEPAVQMRRDGRGRLEKLSN